MNISFASGSRSVTLKVVAIAFLILVLAIPLSMIRGVVLDRTGVKSDATSNIQNSWGHEQTIAGPILKLPFTSKEMTADGTTYLADHVALLLMDDSKISADVETKTLSRGIHEVPVYTAKMEIDASFDIELLDELGIRRADVAWGEAEVLLGISDLAAINSIPVMQSNDVTSEFDGSEHQIGGLPPQLSANLGLSATDIVDDRFIAVDLQLVFNGSNSLQFLPLAENAVVTATSNWSAPSFSGRRLPAEREVNADGFSATWQSSSIGRKIPARWIDFSVRPEQSGGDVFGVRLMQPVGLYQLMFRALKYAVLFIGLTFVSYFLIESVGKLRLHPLQYLLVGLSNSLFYLLLLSLAEHIGFGLAYVLSSIASAALVVGYSVTVLASRPRAFAMSLVLTGLYTFLYLTLTAETYALLAGSVGLWFILATIMYLTRAFNWYIDEDDVC